MKREVSLEVAPHVLAFCHSIGQENRYGAAPRYATPRLGAPDFELVGTDGKRYRRDSVRGDNGLLVMFICNHCPYVKAVLDKMVRDAGELRDHGIGSVAICSNDAADYPEDSFDNMKALATRMRFPFPYLWDETQSVAKAYGAICTPDFFGFNAALELQYRGRLDDAGRAEAR